MICERVLKNYLSSELTTKSRYRFWNLFSESFRVFLWLQFIIGKFWGHSARWEKPVAAIVNSPAWVLVGKPVIPTMAPLWQASATSLKSVSFKVLASSITYILDPFDSMSRNIRLLLAFLRPMILPPALTSTLRSDRLSRLPNFLLIAAMLSVGAK